MMHRVIGAGLRLLGVAAFSFLLAGLSPVVAQSVENGTLAPEPEAARNAAPLELTREQMERIFEIKETKREEFAKRANVDPTAGTAAALPMIVPPATEAETEDGTRYPGVSSALLIGRNNKNTNGNNAAKASTLAETTAINEGVRVYSAGNFNHAERSLNGGVAWIDMPLPAGPADAPILCCDNEWVYDKARGIAIMSSLYINGAVTNGVIRLFVFRTIGQAAANCTYLIDQAGAANNVLMDFPHIGLSRKFLYLATNDIGGGQSARMRRYDLDALASCGAVPFTTYSLSSAVYGQRVFRPAQGGVYDTQYWAIKQTATLLRIFSWAESAAAPVSTTRVISATGTANAVCRGGTGLFDWFDSLSTSLVGFDVNGAVGGGRVNFVWSSSPIGAFPQGHIRGAYLTESGLALIAQPILWNASFCIGLGTVTANEAGDRGFSLAYGGNAAATGAGTRGAVAISDDFSPGIGLVGTFTPTSGGTHNRSDSRYGDYFSARRHEPCSLWFTATNYGLVNGSTAANVDSRYVEFGRGRNEKCYTRFRSLVGTP